MTAWLGHTPLPLISPLLQCSISVAAVTANAIVAATALVNISIFVIKGAVCMGHIPSSKAGVPKQQPKAAAEQQHQ
jgi:hypothetical protein